jgi:hypothetical protein
MNENQLENQIINERLWCLDEIRRSERTVEKTSLFVFISWFFTGPCLLFMFISPAQTVGPFILFSSLTVIGYMMKKSSKQEIQRLYYKNEKLGLELNKVRQQIEIERRRNRDKELSKINSRLHNNNRHSPRKTSSSAYPEGIAPFDYNEEIFRHDQDLKIERSIQRQKFYHNRGYEQEYNRTERSWLEEDSRDEMKREEHDSNNDWEFFDERDR